MKNLEVIKKLAKSAAILGAALSVAIFGGEDKFGYWEEYTLLTGCVAVSLAIRGASIIGNLGRELQGRNSNFLR